MGTLLSCDHFMTICLAYFYVHQISVAASEDPGQGYCKTLNNGDFPPISLGSTDVKASQIRLLSEDSNQSDDGQASSSYNDSEIVHLNRKRIYADSNINFVIAETGSNLKNTENAGEASSQINCDTNECSPFSASSSSDTTSLGPSEFGTFDIPSRKNRKTLAFYSPNEDPHQNPIFAEQRSAPVSSGRSKVTVSKFFSADLSTISDNLHFYQASESMDSDQDMDNFIDSSQDMDDSSNSSQDMDDSLDSSQDMDADVVKVEPTTTSDEELKDDDHDADQSILPDPNNQATSDQPDSQLPSDSNQVSFLLPLSSNLNFQFPSLSEKRDCQPPSTSVDFEFDLENPNPQVQFSIGSTGSSTGLHKSLSCGDLRKLTRSNSRKYPKPEPSPQLPTIQESPKELENVPFPAVESRDKNEGKNESDPSDSTESNTDALTNFFRFRFTKHQRHDENGQPIPENLIGNVKEAVKNIGSSFSSWVHSISQTDGQPNNDKKNRIIRKYKRRPASSKPPKPATSESWKSSSKTCEKQDDRATAPADETKLLQSPSISSCKKQKAEKSKTTAAKSKGKPSSDSTTISSSGLNFRHDDVPLHPNTKRTYWVLIIATTSFLLIAAFCFAWKYGMSRLRSRKFFVWHDTAP